MRNLLVFQSGGVTAVINASMVGIVREGMAQDSVGEIIGARSGIRGLLDDDLIDLRRQSAATLARVRNTPSAALGSTRHKPTDDDIARALDALQRLNVGYVCPIGGNDSADTAHRLHRAAHAIGLNIHFVTVPKTIDNDLPHTDHTPGYASVARAVARMARETAYDTEALPLFPVKLLEVMGRDAGWVAAATALAHDGPDDAPHLIYLPERPPTAAQILDEIAAVVARVGWCVAVVPETLRDPDGKPIGGLGTYVDPFGHAYAASPVAALAATLERERGLRTRYDKPGTIARMMPAPLDLDEAEACGREAVRRAIAGESDRMVTIERIADEPYAIRHGVTPLSGVANIVRNLPDEFIAPDGRGVTDAFRRYALPLLGPDPFPPFGRLESQ
ncbi:MAG: diphosphate--fructose-6-phosphate 1-phosphotransferase [Chloroflexota bacterium]|nr:diphosphate--fructose-6-phosphate 1-phosphotransferase [Chloroflexota bacterium]